jgi:2-dehydro-3-deoxyphosphogluconate aldolase/(4S)-4-hydroxy-2-oxoglutarate aldolase
MARDADLARILDAGIIAVVRAADPAGLTDVVAALADGGVSVAEVTFTVPDAVTVIREAKRALGDRVLLGAGTVLDTETARAALLAGADFVVTPVVAPEVVKLARRYGKVVMSGAFTPTEILAAWEAGSDVVKVFPAEVLGPAFFKAVRGPLPQVKLMPTGGVDLTTAAKFLDAGAVCLGVGSQLIDPKLVATKDFAGLTSLARQYADVVRNYRTKVTR